MSDMSNTATFAATGTIATFIVPTTGAYYLSANGAEAGDSDGGGAGGFAGGDFSLIQGETLLVAVGQQGGIGSYSTGDGSGPDGAGGGGGSFIVLDTGGVDTPLVVAGGGGFTGVGGVSVGGSGQGSSGAGFFSNGAGTYSYRPFPNGLEITGAGAQDFANGLAGGGGGYYATGVPEATIIGGSGGFGGGAGSGNGGGGGGYTGGDIGYGGSSYVSPDATDPLFLAGVENRRRRCQHSISTLFRGGHSHRDARWLRRDRDAEGW